MAKKGSKVEIRGRSTRPTAPPPVIIKLPKPAKEMTKQEVDTLVEEMVEALMGKE